MASSPSSDPEKVAGAKLRISSLPWCMGMHALLSIHLSLSTHGEIEKPCSPTVGRLTVIKHSLCLRNTQSLRIHITENASEKDKLTWLFKCEIILVVGSSSIFLVLFEISLELFYLSFLTSFPLRSHILWYVTSLWITFTMDFWCP